VVSRGVTLAQPFGELQRREYKGARAGHGMRHQPECDFGVVLPDRVLRLDEEAFVVVQDVERHRPTAAKMPTLGRSKNDR
jgi:hypothetical protein